MGGTEGGKEGGGGSKVMVGEGTRGGGRDGGREGGSKVMVGEGTRGWRERRREEIVRGGREEARMLHRHEASVEEGRVEGGRVDDGNKRGRNGVKRPISLLRKGSASTRLWESPRVPSERYEPRPCLCVFVACFDRRIFFTIRQKRIRGGGVLPR